MNAVAVAGMGGGVMPLGIRVTATAIQAPIVRGQSVNAVLRLAVYREQGSELATVKGFLVELDAGAWKDVDSLFLFSNGQEPLFDGRSPLMKWKPSGLSQRLRLPEGMVVKPGYQYFWLGVRLKGSAVPDGYLEMHIRDMETDKGLRLVVQEQGAGFRKRKAVAIRRAWEDGVHTYRIPGIAQTDKKTLIAVYDNRYKHSGDLPANVDVGMSRSVDGGHTWEPMRVIMDMGEPHDQNGVGDPAIVFDPISRKLIMVALWSKGNRSIAGSGPGLTPDETGQLVISESSDDGLTWSKPLSITPQVKDPAWKLFFQGPGNGIVMKNGTIVFAAQYWDAAHMPHATIIYSTDRGRTWKRGLSAPKSNTTEAQVVETTDGTLMLSMRDNRGRFRSVSVTKDMGETWVEHPTSYQALEDPICMAGFMKASVQTGKGLKEFLFFSNPASSFSRVHMSIRASGDLGNSWTHRVLIDERSTFGYSVMVPIDEQTIGLLYEGVRDLYFVRVPVKDIIR
jgi:sialidase-1